mmetsp:Transcript_8462/g.14012  ORF Transcript_8462/g.14012 Transcript_8462/m.14012 type:complete len:80 (-) Transcript_8462:33-272(-)
MSPCILAGRFIVRMGMNQIKIDTLLQSRLWTPKQQSERPLWTFLRRKGEATHMVTTKTNGVTENGLVKSQRENTLEVIR